MKKYLIVDEQADFLLNIESKKFIKNLHKGEEFEILTSVQIENEEWVQIKLNNNQIGFLHGDTNIIEASNSWFSKIKEYFQYGIVVIMIIFAINSAWNYFFSPYGLIDGNGKEEALQFVATEMKDKKGLFKDQYEITIEYLNDRGAILLVDVTKFVKSSNNSDFKYILYILEKDQGTKYVNFLQNYHVKSFVNKPEKSRIKEIAKEEMIIE